MRKSSSLLLAMATALASAAPAGAADYDAPIFISDAPQYKPVEVGSGWYLRGDISYNLDKSDYDLELFGQESENNRFGGSIGMGYHFNDLFRADASIAYISDDEFRYADTTDSVSAENRVLGSFVNGYVDLGTFVGITPYLGAGAGLLYTKYDVDVDSPTLGVTYSTDDRQWEFAYTLNAGFAYQLANNMSLDVGYQYLSSPGTRHVDVATGAVEEGVDYHQVRVGLRYDLW